MVLVVGETAQPQIVPQLTRLVAQLHQSLVQFQGNLRLFLIVVVRGDVCNCLNVAVLYRQGVLVEEMGLLGVV